MEQAKQQPEGKRRLVTALYLRETVEMPPMSGRFHLGDTERKTHKLEMEIAPGWSGVIARYVRPAGTLKDGKPVDELCQHFIPMGNVKNLKLAVD